jgi:hypothetical protein
MGETTLDTIDGLLENALNETDDSNVRYKLRNARQLIQIVEQRHQDLADEDITDAVEDEEILDELRDLGYVK